MRSESVEASIAATLDPARFFAGRDWTLVLQHDGQDQLVWETFRGHLLDAAATRQRRTFASWTAYRRRHDREAEPVLAVYWDRAAERLYVVRFLRLYGFETFEEASNIIQSRPVQKLARELIGCIDLQRVRSPDECAEQLGHYAFLAVVGTSRLPITSPESPLPAFALGELGYLPARGSAGDRSVVDAAELLRYSAAELPTELARAKAVELALRTCATSEAARQANEWLSAWRASGRSTSDAIKVLRTLFNHLALSPHTSFLETFIRWLESLADPAHLGARDVLDLVCYMVILLVRHLTAFDLRRFHQRGANYPDALFLDGLLKLLLNAVEHLPELFGVNGDGDDLACRRRRRALRQALVLRQHYAGLAVPDAPTSFGEQLQVLPASLPKVPVEQIENPASRRKRLFEQDPLQPYLQGKALRDLFPALKADLQGAVELRELGAALYLDRPLGAFKEPGEVDRTPLAVYETFSRSVALQRLPELEEIGIVSRADVAMLRDSLRALHVPGVGVSRLGFASRPAVVALEDANQLYSDVVFRRMPTGSARRLLAAYDLSALAHQQPEHHAWLLSADASLLIRTHTLVEIRDGAPLLTAFDRQLNPRLEFRAAAPSSSLHYAERTGEEYLAEGLRMAAIWEQGQRHELAAPIPLAALH